MRDDLELKVQRLQLQPGDTLVVSTERYLSVTQRDALVATLKGTLPAGVPVFVADGGLTMSTIRHRAS